MRSSLVITFITSSILIGCNPFAPALEDGDPFDEQFADRTTIEGFFAGFRNAYELRDNSMYESLLDSSFTFTYYNADDGYWDEWYFAEDIRNTGAMFRRATDIQLRWNQIIVRDTIVAEQRVRVVRPFNLQIAFDAGDAFRGSGNVNFLLVRRDSTDLWRLLTWIDESDL